jgi:myo-inositol 2-dehydrogenase/D-chiro-inositol 1-dehydrogenase
MSKGGKNGSPAEPTGTEHLETGASKVTRTTLGVIGTGRIGRMHVENLVHSVPEADVKTVASRRVDEVWAEELGIPVCTTDPADVLQDAEIDAVVVTLSSKLHVETICRAACEKPVGFAPAPIVEALDAVREAGVQLQVGFNRRFDPSLQKLQLAVRDGAVGDLHSLRIVNRDPKAPEIEFVRRSGGMFLDFTIHDFDTVRFLSECEIEEVYAAGAALVDEEIAAAGDIDTALVAVRLDNGALCVIDNSRQTHYGYDQRFEAFGSKGNLTVENLRPTSMASSLEGRVFIDRPDPSFVERYREAFVAELRSFVECVRDGSPVAATGEDALAAVRAACAAKISMQENRPVRVAEVGQVAVGETLS